MYRDNDQRAFARALRNQSTDAEKRLWHFLRAQQLRGRKFRRQAAIGPYVVDFVSFKDKLIIELDGPQHLDPEAIKHDIRRTGWLTARGFRIVRFRNQELDEDIHAVVDAIARAIDDLETRTENPPSPSPPRRGEGAELRLYGVDGTQTDAKVRSTMDSLQRKKSQMMGCHGQATNPHYHDRGTTWQAGDVVVRSTERTPNPSERVLLELADGRVMDNLRTESREHRRLISYSRDGASGWTEPEFSRELFEPICFASMVRLAGGAGKGGPPAILFANPDSRASTKAVLKNGAGMRRNLTVRLSTDEGRSWPESRVIEPGRSGYSDMAVDEKGVIYVLFERGNVTEKESEFVPAFISMAKFDRGWVEGK